jgi:D-arabinono-1,4-lactone oxidase
MGMDKVYLDDVVLDELDKMGDGIPFRAYPDHVHHTWARTFHSSPELYVKPQSVSEIEKAVTLARRCRRRLTTVGCGHSPSDLTCTSSWMINLDDFNKILSVDKKSGVVVMQAGIRLWQLGDELEKHGLAVPNLGSINHQSIAGAISTGTHGSTLYHSILSTSIMSLRITLSNSRTILCSPTKNLPLFRAALLSLGALGIITEITFQAVPAFNLHWKQAIYPDTHIFETWPTNIWKQAEYVRVWWFPYTRRATIWRASKTDQDPKSLPYKPSYYDVALGYHVYHNLLYLAQYVPRILPWVEWFVFGMQYGFGSGPKTNIEAIQPSRQALLMNCLYSQYVNEWAIPLHLGPIALRRLSSWLNRLTPADPDYVEHGIPYSADGLWVHAPVEVRVTDSSKTRDLKYSIFPGESKDLPRPYLDITREDGPTLFLNATLYRPYKMDPPCRERYYQGFEYLMKDLGGKPHWAKNFEATGEELREMYGENLDEYKRVRNDADPEGMFVGSWHRRYIFGDGPRFALEEVEIGREKVVPGGGMKVLGGMMATGIGRTSELDDKGKETALSRPTSSQSSFDILHGGEAEESQVLTPAQNPRMSEYEYEQTMKMYRMNAALREEYGGSP